jgi:hypothetical protein
MLSVPPLMHTAVMAQPHVTFSHLRRVTVGASPAVAYPCGFTSTPAPTYGAPAPSGPKEVH